MTTDFKDDAHEQKAIGIGPAGEVVGLFAGVANPWDEITDCPQFSVYFKLDGTIYQKDGPGFAIGDWTEGLGPSVGGNITIRDEGVLISGAATTLDFLGDQVTAVEVSPGYIEVTVADNETGAASGRLNSWTLDSGDKYYADFTHNLDTTEITYLLRDYGTDDEVRPWDFRVLDSNTVRVWVEGNTEDLTINVVSGRGPRGPAGADGADGAPGNPFEFTIPATDLTANGLTVRATVDENSVGFGALLYQKANGAFAHADADLAAKVPARAMAIDTGTGPNKLILLLGYIRKNSWAWTTGADLFASQTEALLTHTAPTADGKFVQKVGHAWASQIVYFSPGDYTLIEIDDD